MSCLFCKVVAKEIPAAITFESDEAVAFRDIHPAAPTHFLVIPRKHIASVHDAKPADAALLGHLIMTARDVAEKEGLAEGGYRLVINTGLNAGQSVFHIHVHVLGGRTLAWPPG